MWCEVSSILVWLQRYLCVTSLFARYSKFLWLWHGWDEENVWWARLMFSKNFEYPKQLRLILHHSTCVGHLECQNEKCDYLHLNDWICSNIEWSQSTPLWTMWHRTSQSWNERYVIYTMACIVFLLCSNFFCPLYNF